MKKIIQPASIIPENSVPGNSGYTAPSSVDGTHTNFWEAEKVAHKTAHC